MRTPAVGMRVVRAEDGELGTIDAVDGQLFVVAKNAGGWFGWTSFEDLVWRPIIAIRV